MKEIRLQRVFVGMLCWLGLLGCLTWGQVGCRGTEPTKEQTTGDEKQVVVDGSEPVVTPDDGNPPKDDGTPPKDDGTPPKDDSKPSSDKTVMDVQNPDSPNRVKKGDAVILKGVVVVSPVFVVSKTTGLQGFYVVDGTFPTKKWGGVQVVVDGEFKQDLQIGDKVDIEGAADEFSGNTQVVARADRGGSVTKTGTVAAADIKPIVLKSEDIPGTPTDKADPDKSPAEPYEGVLVELKDVEVEEEADQFGLWKLKGGAMVDDNFFLGYKPKKGDKLAYVRGILSYSFDLYRLLPRSSADIDGAKPGCTTDDDCGTGRRCSNEACQFITCTKDEDCKAGEKCNTVGANTRCDLPQQTAKVMDVQNPASPNYVKTGNPVELKGLIVTTQVYDVSANLKGFFVSDPSFPAEWGGVQVVVSSSWTDSVVIGDEIDIVGRPDEFFSNTQVKVDLTAGGSVTKTGNNKKELVKPTVLTFADIPGTPADAAKPNDSISEKYEGMLIEFQNVTVGAEADSKGEWKIDGDFIVDDVLFKATPTKGDTISVLRGIVQFNFGTYRLLPRDAADIQK